MIMPPILDARYDAGIRDNDAIFATGDGHIPQ